MTDENGLLELYNKEERLIKEFEVIKERLNAISQIIDLFEQKSDILGIPHELLKKRFKRQPESTDTSFDRVESQEILDAIALIGKFCRRAELEQELKARNLNIEGQALGIILRELRERKTIILARYNDSNNYSFYGLRTWVVKTPDNFAYIKGFEPAPETLSNLTVIRSLEFVE